MTMLVALVVLAGVDTLTVVHRGAMQLKAPTQWAASEGDDGTTTWTAPESAGAVSFYTGAMESSPTPAACVTRLVEALGKDGFTRFTVANKPAAKKVMSDRVGTEGASDTVVTTTVVGCDGKTKWLLTFTATQKASARLGPVLKRMLDSISYAR
ncbi:MAG: hypothetical protein JNG84_08055 [Archangium sp.]|nr:hypothetical protein [Archangium sp.]